MEELHTGKFYRIDGRILYCVRYTWYANNPGPDAIHFEGILPEDYAAYLTHHVIGEMKEPYRTVAEIASIPYPEPVEIRFSSDAKIEALSNEEAMREWQENRKNEQNHP